MLESIIRTDLSMRGLMMYDDEIASLAKEVREHQRWHGRRMTNDEAIKAIRDGIEKMARRVPSGVHSEGEKK